MKRITTVLLSMALFASCHFLDPLPNGNYNEENYDEYPTILQGFIHYAYNLLPSSYCNYSYMYADATTDNAVMRSKSDGASLLATGNIKMANFLYNDIWTSSYKGIMYCNSFLQDNLGYNTRYMIDAESDRVMRRNLQGDAYGLRALFHATLLSYFGGVGENGRLLGIPVMKEVVPVEKISDYVISRPSYDECVSEIISDCDSALAYLPLANRDFLKETSESAIISGAVRYKSLDRVSIHALKAMVYLAWASPAFNPSNDISRYDLAAKEAAWVIDHKLTKEAAVYNGFNPLKKFIWTDVNSPEAIFVSTSQGTTAYETALYPYSFGGNAVIGATQELVDAFPASDGYPIEKSKVYDPSRPYENRDPRFYSTIYYDGADVLRGSDGSVMYTFMIADGGRDAMDAQAASPTGYYIKKFLYSNWNSKDATILTASRSIFYFRWTQMCLAFAEAANRYIGPNDSVTYGISARDALSYIRSRATNDGLAGVGAAGDPYLDECAAKGKEAFEELVRNEWRIETCFEGNRMFDLRRWGMLEQLNKPVSGVKITTSGNGKQYEKVTVETRSFPSLWFPVPYLQIRKTQMTQNKGWETYK